MYPNVHGITGALCTTGTYLITKDMTVSLTLGALIAFYSHDLLDRLGESNYGSMKKFFIIEIPCFLLFLYVAFSNPLTWLFIVGWVMGNGMDLVDKKFGLSIYNLKKYPYGTFFKCHRRKPNFNFTRTQTILACYVMSAILVILFIL